MISPLLMVGSSCLSLKKVKLWHAMIVINYINCLNKMSAIFPTTLQYCIFITNKNFVCRKGLKYVVGTLCKEVRLNPPSLYKTSLETY